MFGWLISAAVKWLLGSQNPIDQRRGRQVLQTANLIWRGTNTGGET